MGIRNGFEMVSLVQGRYDDTEDFIWLTTLKTSIHLGRRPEKTTNGKRVKFDLRLLSMLNVVVPDAFLSNKGIR
jgi:hypothetical protein